MLAGGVQPPPSPLTLHPVAGGLQLGWTGTGERVVYRVFERPGVNEAEEEVAEAEEASTGGEAGALLNTTRPKITGEPREGQQLTTTSGNWAGAEPTLFDYEWRRCRGGECTPIAGATSATYTPGPADVGYALESIVTAIASGEVSCSAVSFPTQLVKSLAEATRSKVESMKLGAALGFALITQIYGAPLEPVPYELKLTIDNKLRAIVGTPLPAAAPAPAPASTSAGAPANATPTPTTQSPTCSPEAAHVCSGSPSGSTSSPPRAGRPRRASPPTRSSAPAGRARSLRSADARTPAGSRPRTRGSHTVGRAMGVSDRRPAGVRSRRGAAIDRRHR